MRRNRSQRLRRIRRSLVVPALGLLLGTCYAPLAYPQGCSQCRESLGQTPGRTQTAYRRAITLMTVAGTTVFLASILALKRFR